MFQLSRCTAMAMVLISVIVVLSASTSYAQVGGSSTDGADSRRRRPQRADVFLADFIVAKLNDEIITRHDVEAALTPAAGSDSPEEIELRSGLAVQVLEACEALAAGDAVPLGELERVRATLQLLVDRVLLRQIAGRELGERYLENVRAAVERYLQRRTVNLQPESAETPLDASDSEMDRRIFEALLARSINVGREQVRPSAIRRFYSSHLDDFREPARVSFSHIMIRAVDGASEADALARAHALHAQLAAGADFERLAGEHSDGPRARNGGNWEATDPSMLTSELAGQLRESPVGKLSAVFATDRGYHIVRVLSRQEEALREFVDAQADIQDYLYMQFLDRAIDAWLNKERDEAFVWALPELQPRHVQPD